MGVGQHWEMCGVSIQSFDFSTGQVKDGKAQQSVVFLDNDSDVSIITSYLRKSRSPLLGQPRAQREAIELMRKHKKGVLYLDGDREDVSVDAFLEKTVASFPGFKVVVVSKALTKESVAELNKHGAAGFLIKPVTETALTKMLDRIA
jgi:response regulator of citrate/malate metabolism